MDLQQARPDLLTQTAEGSLRLAGTRVTLDAVIQAFRDGATPEEICQDFPTLALAQVYNVLAFYLTHPQDVDAYVAEEMRAAATCRQDLEGRYSSFLAELRQRLVARRTSSAPHP